MVRCCVVLVGVFVAVCSALNTDEQFALRQLCAALSGVCPETLGTDLCTQLGPNVGCECSKVNAGCAADSEAQTVVSIAFTNGFNITGTLPTELGLLTNLHVLSIPGQSISGTIPTELGQTSLYSIELYKNKLIGTIPSQLSQLPLVGLQLWGNSLQGSIPVGLFGSDLQIFDVAANQLTGVIPEDVGSATSMILLSAGQNQLTGSIPVAITSCTSLRELSLNDNKLTGLIPSELGQMDSLSSIGLHGNFLEGSIPTELGNLTPQSNSYLTLGNNALKGTIPSQLGRLSNIAQLELGNLPSLTGTIPIELTSLFQLSFLWIHNTSVYGTVPASLGDLANMQSLRLHGNLLSGSIPMLQGFATADFEQELFVNGNYFVGDIDTLHLQEKVDFNCANTFLQPAELCFPTRACQSGLTTTAGVGATALCMRQTTNMLQGTLEISPAEDEQCFSEYFVYLGTEAPQGSPIARVPKTPRVSGKVYASVNVSVGSNENIFVVSSAGIPTSFDSAMVTQLSVASIALCAGDISPSRSPTVSQTVSSTISLSGSVSTAPSSSASTNPSTTASIAPVATESPVAAQTTTSQSSKSEAMTQEELAALVAALMVVIGAISVTISITFYRRKRLERKIQAARVVVSPVPNC